jgi:hypothetical protein
MKLDRSFFDLFTCTCRQREYLCQTYASSRVFTMTMFHSAPMSSRPLSFRTTSIQCAHVSCTAREYPKLDKNPPPIPNLMNEKQVQVFTHLTKILEIQSGSSGTCEDLEIVYKNSDVAKVNFVPACPCQSAYGSCNRR